MRSIFSIIGKSPFGPLARHTEKVHETVSVVRPLMQAFIVGDWEQTEALYQRISKLEHKADILKDEIRDHLPRSLFLPVDRGDLLKFLKEQDSIADRAEDLGVILTLRRTPTPPDLHDEILEFVERVIQTSETWYSAAMELTVLQEASFSGPHADKVLRLIAQVNHDEWEADKAQASVSKALLEHEEELGAVSVYFWMKIAETLGKVADHAENTAEFLRLMMIRD